MSFKRLVYDISKYQGNIDFKKLKATNPFGVIIRVGYRGYGKAGTLVTDPYFETFVKGCIDNDIPYGVYFFSQATNVSEAIEEAKYTLNIVIKQKVQPLFPIYIDTEWANVLRTGRADKLTKAERTSIVKAFCQTIEKAGYFAGIYASTSWYNNQLIDNELIHFSHWVAHYSSKCGYTEAIGMWQFTSSYKVNGISGKVDANWCYIDFPKNIKNKGLNGYNSEKVKMYTLSFNREISEYAFDKISKLAATLGISLTVSEVTKYKVATSEMTDGDVQNFKNLASCLIEEITVKEI